VLQDRANFSKGRAKLFLSCGQNPQYRERDWGEKVANALGPNGVGFHVFFAPRVQDSKSLTQIIFRELEDSDYYVLIDFKREKLLPPFNPWRFFRVRRIQHRGSLFSHQEFALACYLGLELAPFREAGVEPLTGVVGAVMGNAIEFKDRKGLVELIRDHIQEKIERDEWSLSTKNTFQLVKAPDQGIKATWLSGMEAAYYHIHVRNLHWRKPATNCYAYLDEVIDLNTGKDVKLYTCELKWEGTRQSGVRIQPKGYRGLDAFVVVLSQPRELLLMPQTDAQNYIHHFKGKTHLEITYVVCSDQFPDMKQTFEVIFDGDDSLQFKETVRSVVQTRESSIQVR
jgi:hypothetical protein